MLTVSVAAASVPGARTNVATVTGNGITNTASDPTDVVWASATVLTATPGSAALGQAIALTAAVTAGATGKVLFLDGATPLGTAAVAAGKATFTTPLPGAGLHSLRAVYSGDGTYNSSRSAAVAVTVSAAVSSGLNSLAAYAVGAGPAALAQTDLNRDGRTDLLVLSKDTNSVGVLLGNANGTIQARTDYAAGAAPVDMAVADFDGNGIPDVAVLSPASGTVGILLGAAGGTLQAPVNYDVTTGTVRHIAAGDWNSDGNVDLAVTTSSNIFLLAGNSNGTFRAPVSAYASSDYTYLTAADVNSDGCADLLTSRSYRVYVLTGNCEGGFQYSTDLYVSYNLTGAPVATDWNADGKPDIAMPAGSYVIVAMGNGDGSFQSVLNQNFNPAATGAAAGDLNGDGKLDLLVANGAGTVSAFLGNGNGTFQSAANYTVGTGPQFVLTGDFNGDGKTDLATLNSGNTLSVLLGVLPPVLTAQSSHTGSFYAGQKGAVYTITITNSGPSPTAGTVTVTDALPAALTATAMTGGGWTCDLPTLACTRADVLAAGGSYPAITLTVNVAANASALLLNQVSVSGGGAPSAATTDPTSITTPAALLTPAPNSTLAGASATFTWDTGTGAVQYHLAVGTTGAGSANLFNQNTGTTRTQTVSTLPVTGGTVYVRLWSLLPAGWMYNDYTYTAANAPVFTRAAMLSPAAGGTLAGTAVTFSWDAGVAVSQYHLYVGTAGAGSNNVFSQNTGTARSQAVNNLPAGGTVYVRLWSLTAGGWLYNDYTYTAISTGARAAMLTPVAGSTLAGSSVTFTWDAGSGVLQYHLYVGTDGVGGRNLFSLNTGTSRSQVVNTLPNNGTTVYVRLWSLLASGWQSTDYTYTAANGGKGVITSPAPGSVLPGASTAFTWNMGGAAEVRLCVGTSAGSCNISSYPAQNSGSVQLDRMPVDGSTVYVRLWSLYGGQWVYNDYTYTAAVKPVLAVMTSPLPGSVLAGTAVTFTWDAGPATTQYHLSAGVGGVGTADLVSQNTGTARSLQVYVPANAATVFVRLWSLVGGGWWFNDYAYTAGGTAGIPSITPLAGSTLAGSTVTFTWAGRPWAAQYHLDVGTTGVGSRNLFSLNTGAGQTQVVNVLPTNGATVYVRLWFLVSGTWLHNDYTYTARN